MSKTGRTPRIDYCWICGKQFGEGDAVIFYDGEPACVDVKECLKRAKKKGKAVPA